MSAVQPDGVILTPPHSDNPLIVNLLAKEKIPFVRIGSRGNGAGIPISMDDEGSARMATEYLIAKGHKRIGFIAGSSEYSLSGWRTDGWRSAMEAADLAVDGLLANGDFTRASGEAAARDLLCGDNPPTAIIASNDQMALGTLAVANELGLNVPVDLSLISFDNTPTVNFTQPALTAVDQPVADTAAVAVELIIAAQKDDTKSDRVKAVRGRLVERDSVGPAPA
jgi:LacI family transcriptional regulator